MDTKSEGVRIGHNQQVGHYKECFHCQNRQVGCHSQCKAYLAFWHQKEIERDERKQKRLEDEDISGVFKNRVRYNDRTKMKERK